MALQKKKMSGTFRERGEFGKSKSVIQQRLGFLRREGLECWKSCHEMGKGRVRGFYK